MGIIPAVHRIGTIIRKSCMSTRNLDNNVPGNAAYICNVMHGNNRHDNIQNDMNSFVYQYPIK